jgi:molybdopterin-guanine dinucleotide biosynthesis protein A
MACDKALLPMPGGTLLEHLASKAKAVAGNVALVGPPERYGGFGFDCLPDCAPGLGPLGGIYTALASGRGEYNLILACDMPDLDDSLLTELFAIAESGSSRCVVAKDANGRVHPLCGIYRQDCLEVVAQAAVGNRLRLMDLLNELVAVHAPFAGSITNCNTPAEWAAAAHA